MRKARKSKVYPLMKYRKAEATFHFSKTSVEINALKITCVERATR